MLADKARLALADHHLATVRVKLAEIRQKSLLTNRDTCGIIESV
jgi:hypothetical protein